MGPNNVFRAPHAPETLTYLAVLTPTVVVMVSSSFNLTRIYDFMRFIAQNEYHFTNFRELETCLDILSNLTKLVLHHLRIHYGWARRQPVT
jgi:hypothetical protein